MIKFGTSGWRAVMGEEFTFQNVRLVVQSLANLLTEKYPGGGISVLVNYDTRFLSERFAAEAARILSTNRIRVLLSERDAPSQAHAYQIIKRKAQGGINFTASFNPPEYNGLKYNVETGAPAMPDVTDALEEEIRRLQGSFTVFPGYPRKAFIEKIDLRNDYLTFIQDKIDFEQIRKSGIKVGVDSLYGTSREYLDETLAENGIPVEEIHGYIDPYFGGIAPSCTEKNLAELRKLVLEQHCDLGIATDADGDRFGVLDHEGRIIHPNLILAVLLDFLIEKKGLRGGIARSVATTHLIDRIARAHDLPLFKTPVGFKFLADLLLQNKIIFGGEESASVGFSRHLPEKDGIFAGLMVAEMIASTGTRLSDLVDGLFRKYGERIGLQKDITANPERTRNLRRLIKLPPTRLAGRPVENVETIEGIKFDFTGDDWVLLRPSGTEPLIRCYAEAGTKKDLRALVKAALEKLG